MMYYLIIKEAISITVLKYQDTVQAFIKIKWNLLSFTEIFKNFEQHLKNSVKKSELKYK